MMRTSIVVRETGEHIALRVMSLLILLLVLSGTCSAVWPPYQSDPSWNIVRNKVLMNLPPAMMSLDTDTDEVISCQFIEDQFLEQSVAYSCSGNSSYGSYQRVYAYNTSSGNSDYLVDNTTGHIQTFMYTQKHKLTESIKQFSR